MYKEKGWLNFHLPNFASAIEEARTRKQNPEVPDWLKADYFDALQDIAHYCLVNSKGIKDRNFSRSLLLLIAILLNEKGVFNLPETISIGEEEKVIEIFREFG